MSNITRIFYNYIRITALHAIVLVLGIVSVVILARTLGPYDYGRYNLFIFASQLLSLFAWTWCLNPAAAKYSSEEFLKGKIISKTFTAETVLISMCVVVIALVCFFLRGRISSFLGFGSLSIVLFLHLIVTAIFNLVYFCFQGSMNFRFYGKMPVVRSILFVVPLVVLYFNKSLGVEFVIMALVASYLITTLIVWPRLMRICTLTFDAGALRDIVVFSVPMIVFSTANFALDWIDKYWLRHMVSVYAVGIYSAAWILTTNFVIIPQQLYTIVMPLITSYKLENKRENVLFYLNRMVPQLSFFFSAIAALLIVVSGVVLPLMYGMKYLDSVNIFIVLALSSLYMGIKYFYNPVSTVYNYIKLTGTINVASAILCVGLNYVLIGFFGIIGAAAGTALSSFIACCAVSHAINRQFGIVNWNQVLCSAPALVIAVVCLISRNVLVNAAAAVAVFAAAFLALKKYRVFSREDLEYIRRIEMPAWLEKGAVALYKGLG
ncbi:MAG TPA: oligosaccharide flippase family protein [Candidatus Omnitrophota bacterium]|nr:oligosaccharide flippase family protein [Candidatus Omnitrophota bacterium]